ncbi:competence protein CoiA [Ligilactobacillus ceti]|uniref:Competence protein transcription factor n=1 Tax=Ligilactobacillus ceti DSM 22408 TaxID=1122146 RepID=A0A0R2KSH4_9LACO|nr:competence protein CoiA family protein [Ligilactobacillus ceti]KRN89076.1 competence protein transcription factor [Ligilactobacillus ceti DSM 22408]
MQYAYLNNQQLITAGEACQKFEVPKQAKYYCPYCREPVFLKQGRMTQPYFAHFSKGKKRVVGQGETEEHLRGKEFLFKLGQLAQIDVTLEDYQSEFQQQPDVLYRISPEEYLALEYRCAPMSLKELEFRSRGYRQAGYRYCWFLGPNYQFYNKKKLTRQIAQFLRWHVNLGYYLLYLDTRKPAFKLVYNIQMADFLPIKAQTYFAKDWDELRTFMHQPQKVGYFKLTTKQQEIQKKCLTRNCRRSTGVMLDLQKLCYEQRRDTLTALQERLQPYYQAPTKRIPNCYYQLLSDYLGAQKTSQYCYRTPFVRQELVTMELRACQ